MEPEGTGAGEAVLVTARSACGKRKYATGASWSESRSGRVGSLKRTAGKSALARAYSRPLASGRRLDETSTWSKASALPSKT